MWRTVGLLILLLLGGTGKAHGRQEADPEQIDRRDRRQPELILETGGADRQLRRATVHAGWEVLLAAGDDKVVRVWRVKDGKLEKADPHVLRWARWREQRGSIYAMDIDAEGKRVAVAGLGMRPRLTVAVLDRETGGVITWLDGLHKESMDVSTIRALVFSPSGKKLALGMSDGRVWEWGLKGEPWLVGRHAPLPDAPKDLNRIRLLHYFTDDDLLSVAESGEVGRWDLRATPPRRALKISHPPSVREAAVTPDGERLVICAYGKTPQVAFLPLTGTGKTDGIGLKLTEQRCCVALSPDGKAMLVGVGANPAGKELEGDDRLRLYNGASPKPVWESAPGYRIDKVTFSPCGKFFAVAGGPNYEVSLWKRSDLSRPSGVASGEGAGLWEVAFSEGSDTLVGFRDRRASPRALRNRQGGGAVARLRPEEPGVHAGRGGVQAPARPGIRRRLVPGARRQSHGLGSK